MGWHFPVWMRLRLVTCRLSISSSTGFSYFGDPPSWLPRFATMQRCVELVSRQWLAGSMHPYAKSTDGCNSGPTPQITAWVPIEDLDVHSSIGFQLTGRLQLLQLHSKRYQGPPVHTGLEFSWPRRFSSDLLRYQTTWVARLYPSATSLRYTIAQSLF